MTDNTRTENYVDPRTSWIRKIGEIKGLKLGVAEQLLTDITICDTYQEYGGKMTMAEVDQWDLSEVEIWYAIALTIKRGYEDGIGRYKERIDDGSDYDALMDDLTRQIATGLGYRVPDKDSDYDWNFEVCRVNRIIEWFLDYDNPITLEDWVDMIISTIPDDEYTADMEADDKTNYVPYVDRLEPLFGTDAYEILVRQAVRAQQALDEAMSDLVEYCADQTGIAQDDEILNERLYELIQNIS